MNATHVEMNTRFYDSSVVHEAVEGENNMMVGIPRIPKPIVPLDLSYVVNRPYLLTTYTWSSTSVIRATAFQLLLPTTLLDIVNITNKLDFVAYYRPDIEVEIQVNGTKFHYGRLIMCVIQFPDGLDGAYLQPESASTWPMWYQISANSQQSVKFRIPYRHYVQRIAMFENDQPLNDFVAVNAFVSVPLSFASGTTPPPVIVSVYARFANANPEGLNIALVAQSSDGELSMKVNMNIVDSIVSKTEQVVSDIASVTTSVSKFASDIGIGGFNAGFSVPVNPAATTSMQIRQPLLAKANDMPNCVHLGPSQTNKMDMNPALVNSTGDDMLIAKIVGQPSLVMTHSISSTMTADTTLWTFLLGPPSCYYQDYSLIPTAGTIPANPQYYIGRMFNFWRGGWNIHISFVASQFHSCRCRLMWLPAVKGIPGAVNNEDIGNSYNVVMDINKQTEYSIHVPFYSMTEWLTNNYSSLADYRLNYNGILILTLQTPLTSNTTPTQPIYYQIFVSMAEDAQFACPTLSFTNLTGNPQYGTFTAPTFPTLLDAPKKRSERRKKKAIIEEFDDLTGTHLFAQSSETMECELPSSSSSCLRDTKYVNIAGPNTFGVKLHGESTVFEFTSVKQLTNMLTPLYGIIALDTNNYTGIRFAPFGVNTASSNDPCWNNYFTQIRAIFRFGRGCVRGYGQSTQPSLQACAFYEPGFYTESNAYYQENDGVFPTFTTAAGHIRYTSGGYQYFPSITSMPLDVIMPYYALTPCQTLNSSSTSGYITPTGTFTLAWSTQGTTPTVNMFVATADDFMFGVQTGIPYLKTF